LEKPLLRRFARATASPFHLRACLALAVLALAACSTSGPARVAPSRVAQPAPAAEAVAGEPVPAAAQASYDRAVQALAAGDATEAELELEQLILEYPDFPGPYVNLAIVYMHGDREDEAEQALARALALDPASAPANNQLGILRRQQGRFADAEQAYEAAIAADADYALAYYNLGVLLDLYLHQPAEALAKYQRYQELRGEPDETVAKWIIDLRRRVGAGDNTAQVAQEGAS
jgi:lipoprotein NlpI